MAQSILSVPIPPGHLTFCFGKADRLVQSTDKQPEKTADIWRRYHWFPRQMTSEKRAQIFITDDASLPRSG